MPQSANPYPQLHTLWVVWNEEVCKNIKLAPYTTYSNKRRYVSFVYFTSTRVLYITYMSLLYINWTSLLYSMLIPWFYWEWPQTSTSHWVWGVLRNYPGNQTGSTNESQEEMRCLVLKVQNLVEHTQHEYRENNQKTCQTNEEQETYQKRTGSGSSQTNGRIVS